MIDHVLITGSEGLGFSLIDGAAFQAGSTHLSVHNSAVVGQVYGNAVASIPEEGSDYSGNIGAYVSIDGPGGPSRMTKSGTWGDIGVDYKVNGSLDLEGTAASPTILTLDAGAQVSFAPSKYIGIGGLGAAGLKALGTLEKPVVFKASDSLSAGSWAGIYFSSDTVSTETTLEHVEVAFAGADQFYRRQGAIIVDDAHITLSHANIHDSLCNGLAMYGTGTVSGDDSTWTFDAVGCQNIYDEKD